MNAPTINIRKGYDIPLKGAPARDVESIGHGEGVAFVPPQTSGLKLRALVREGDTVRCGQPIVRDKAREGLMFAAPASGTVRSLVLGRRRVLQAVVIAPAPQDEYESYPRFEASAIRQLSRERILEPLLRSGLFACLRRRPFSKVPKPDGRPRDIFVNAMSTAPFLADIRAAVRGHETAFQAGLDALTRLTDGRVFLCLPATDDLPPALQEARNVERRYFAGPHPAGNSSVHIHHLAPIRPGDEVWTIRALHVIRIGRLLLEGRFPADTIVALGGPHVREGHARHYRVRVGGRIETLLKGRVNAGEHRVVAGDALSGSALALDGFLPWDAESLTVLPEDRSRHLLGWAAPGLNAFSLSRLYLSRWWPARRPWALGTNRHGSTRAMVVTGLYDRYVPMKILPDYLVRAVLARDWEEAVKLGLLEVDPEDFALCAFACPSKMDLVGIIRDGLAQLESEGL